MIEAPNARIPEEAGVVIPHAGICEQGVRHLIFLPQSAIIKPITNKIETPNHR